MSEDHDPCAGCALAAAAGEPVVGIGRRQFLGAATLATVAALLAACSAGDATGPTLPGNGQVTVKVGDYPALGASGGIQILNSYRVAVVNTGSGYVVFSTICPHQGGAVTTGGPGFFCSRHGAEWTTDGVWVGGQRTTNLARIASSFDAGSGVLTIG